MPRGSYKRNRKLFIFIVFLLILTFLPPSQEIFGWGGGSDGKSKEADSARKALKKNVPEKKFKFHKIERIELDPDDKSLDEDEEAASDNAGEEIEDATREQQATGEGYEDDNESQKDRDSTINSANNDDEEEEFQFKKARTAQKATKKSKVQQDASAETSKEAGKSWFGSIFSSIFGSSENDKQDKTADEEEDDDNASKRHRSYEEDDEEDNTAAAKTNGIIDWLLWLGEKTGRSKSGEKDSTEDADDATSGENWLQYFNRWPFNSLFPIGKPPKPIAMPKLAAKKAAAAGHKQRHDSMGDGGEYSGEAMSQENFDSLLSTLPNFVVNPNDIREPECRKQMQIFQHQLRGHKLWTLQSKYVA